MGNVRILNIILILISLFLSHHTAGGIDMGLYQKVELCRWFDWIDGLYKSYTLSSASLNVPAESSAGIFVFIGNLSDAKQKPGPATP